MKDKENRAPIDSAIGTCRELLAGADSLTKFDGERSLEIRSNQPLPVALELLSIRLASKDQLLEL